MVIALIITWIFWGTVIILDTIRRPVEWYLFFIPAIVISFGIYILAKVSDELSMWVSICLHGYFFYEGFVTFFINEIKEKKKAKNQQKEEITEDTKENNNDEAML